MTNETDGKRGIWSLYENGRYLHPLVFSNGKSQEDVVREVIELINSGNKIIFIKGICGTGKSALALHLAKELGKASIVVPIKNLQKQYENDYTHKKYLLKGINKLDIKVLTGRKNHRCPFRQDCDCDNPYLPCKIEIKEKNKRLLRRYIRMNPFVKWRDFRHINSVRRMSLAPACPYWSPILPSEFDISILRDAKKREYKGLYNVSYVFYQRKKGCSYYDQFNAYIDSDVLIFNSHKYMLETLMNRKPATEVEIIDECDEFLDSLSNEGKINLNRLLFALSNLSFYDESLVAHATVLRNIVKEILENEQIERLVENKEIVHVKNTRIVDLLKYFLHNPEFLDLIKEDEYNYCHHCYEVALNFENFLDDSYVCFDRLSLSSNNRNNKETYKEAGEKAKEDEDQLIARIVTINLEKRMAELLNKNKILVLMSGTIHSPSALENIFGLSDYKIVEAETAGQGKITKVRTGSEVDCRYENFEKGRVTREQYLRAFSKCIEFAKRPVLVHVISFFDLPTKEECEIYNICNIMIREELKEIQEKFKEGQLIREFKEGRKGVLFSTKCKRGMDFPNEQCNSIIFTKYPNPSIQDLFWKLLRKTRPEHFWMFYKDKARREFLQRVYRAIRSKNDHVYLLSPDIRVLNFDLTKKKDI